MTSRLPSAWALNNTGHSMQSFADAPAICINLLEIKMKKFVRRVAVVSGLLVVSGVPAVLSQAAFGQSVEVAQASGSDTVGAAVLIETKARVIGVDAASYSATLKGAGGRVFEVTVSPEVGDIGK